MGVMQKHILNENIKLKDKESNKTIFRRQMSQIGEQGRDAAVQDKEELEQDIDLDKAELVMEEEAKAEVA